MNVFSMTSLSFLVVATVCLAVGADEPGRSAGGQSTERGVPSGSRTAGDPEKACQRLAAQVNSAILRRGLAIVDIPDFLVDGSGRLKPSRAPLPQYLRGLLAESLASLSESRYQVRHGEYWPDASILRGISIEAYTPSVIFDRLSIDRAGRDGAVVGRLKVQDDRLHISFDLLDGKASEPEEFTESVSLSFALLGDMGYSFDRPRTADERGGVATMLERILRGSERHPLGNPDFPFRISVHTVELHSGDSKTGIKTRSEKPQIDLPGEQLARQQMGISAATGELFEIHIQNRTPHTIGMVLLIDGLSTRGHQLNRIEGAPLWRIPPTKSGALAVEGWYPLRGAKGDDPTRSRQTMRRFRFMEASNSTITPMPYDQVPGVITAAFFAQREPPPTIRSPFVDAGPAEERELELGSFRRGRLLAVVHLHYVGTELDQTSP